MVRDPEEENKDGQHELTTSEVENISIEISAEEDNVLEEENSEANLITESRSIGSGLVQLWQVVPDGQNQEGKTTAEIMKALQCRPNHNLYPLNGQSQQQTYVNSCYVDDAYYLGEDANYYYIYLSGYEGKVPKSETHTFSLDLNGDKQYVDYKIQTVAYYVPATLVARSAFDDSPVTPDVPELNYYDQYLNKYSDVNVRSIDLYSTSTVQSPSYYANDNGTLVHYVTNNVTVANNYSKVIVGKAPNWMETNVKYYSYDGVYFYKHWQNIRVNGQGAINQNNYRYFGSHVGNKGSGMNVKYASDPFWGEKIAGWYYRFDSQNGLKDYDYYTIGIKQSNKVVDVKSQASSNSPTLYQTKNKRSNLTFGNYPFLITGEQSGYYKVKTDTPIVNQKPLFSATYDWAQTNGYVAMSQVDIINHKGYKNPTGTSVYGKFSNHIDQASISSKGLYLYGWAFADGIDISKDEYVTKEIVLTNEKGAEVQRIKANNIFNQAFADAYSGPYQYARYSQTLNIRNLSNGIYYLNIDFSTNSYGTFDAIKSNNVIDTGKVRVGSKVYRVYNSEKGKQLILEVSDFDDIYLNHVDQAEVHSNGLYLYGWAFTEGLDMSDGSSIKKAIIIKDKSGKEVQRSIVNNVFNQGFADAYNGPYQYARYKQTIDVISLPTGTYTLEIQLDATDYSNTAMLQSNYAIDSGEYRIGNKVYRIYNNGKGTSLKLESNYAIDSGEYRIGNKVYRIYNNGKGTSLKLEVSTVKAGNQQNHVDKAEFNSKGLYFYGWSFIENLDMSNNNNVKKTIIIKNSNAQEVKREVVNNMFHQGFADAYNAPYQYARYEKTIDVSSLAVGTYTLDIETTVSGLSKVSNLKSNYAIDSGEYQIGNKVYRIYNSGKGASLKLEVSTVKAGNQQNHVDKAEFNSKGLYFYGWSFIENLDMSNTNHVKKTIIFKNSHAQEVKREIVDNVFHQGFADAYNAAYQYARYEKTIDVSSLALGTYTLDIETTVSGLSKVSNLKSNYAIDSGEYRIGNKVYRIYNNGKGTSLKLEVSKFQI